ncbi:MAG: type I 3-dehydroquinate dehydratase [Victivallales bacterium]|nr:type I 3-dehydroquinate dehydratase [Victivallales bacterium]
MKFSFLNKAYPVIAGIFAGQTPQELIAKARQSEFEGAQGMTIDLLDLKPEFRNHDALKSVIDAVNLPFMFYFYRKDNWQNLDDDARQDILLAAADAGAAMIDVMGDLYDPSPLEITRNPEAIDKQKRLIDKIHAKGAEVVISSHMPESARTTEQVLEHMFEVAARGPDVVKIVTGVNNEDELAEAFRTTMTLKRELKIPFIHLCGGKFSRPHRFLSPALGVAICFAVPGYETKYGFNQPTIRAMKAVQDNIHWNINDVL